LDTKQNIGSQQLNTGAPCCCIIIWCSR